MCIVLGFSVDSHNDNDIPQIAQQYPFKGVHSPCVVDYIITQAPCIQIITQTQVVIVVGAVLTLGAVLLILQSLVILVFNKWPTI